MGGGRLHSGSGLLFGAGRVSVGASRDDYMGDEEEAMSNTIRDRYKWKQVEAPKPWRPKYNGEELCGFYGGKSVRDGQFGQYQVIIVHVPQRGAFMLSGVLIVNLVDAAGFVLGSPIRVVWKGLEKLTPKEDDERPRTMKRFDVFEAEGEAIAEEDLPEVHA
jgi:hypothetical protein